MLSLPASVRVYVAAGPVDMRMGHHGLAAVVVTGRPPDAHPGRPA